MIRISCPYLMCYGHLEYVINWSYGYLWVHRLHDDFYYVDVHCNDGSPMNMIRDVSMRV